MESQGQLPFRPCSHCGISCEFKCGICMHSASKPGRSLYGQNVTYSEQKLTGGLAPLTGVNQRPNLWEKSAAQNENPDRFSCADTQWFRNVCTGPYFYSNLLFSELKTTVLQNYDLGQWKVTCISLTKVKLHLQVCRAA